MQLSGPVVPYTVQQDLPRMNIKSKNHCKNEMFAAPVFHPISNYKWFCFVSLESMNLGPCSYSCCNCKGVAILSGTKQADIPERFNDQLILQKGNVAFVSWIRAMKLALMATEVSRFSTCHHSARFIKSVPQTVQPCARPPASWGHPAGTKIKSPASRMASWTFALALTALTF